MSLPKYKDLKDYELAEIELQLVKAKKELLFLRIQKANFSRFLSTFDDSYKTSNLAIINA